MGHRPAPGRVHMLTLPELQLYARLEPSGVPTASLRLGLGNPHQFRHLHDRDPKVPPGGRG